MENTIGLKVMLLMPTVTVSASVSFIVLDVSRVVGDSVVSDTTVSVVVVVEVVDDFLVFIFLWVDVFVVDVVELEVEVELSQSVKMVNVEELGKERQLNSIFCIRMSSNFSLGNNLKKDSL